MLKITLPCWRCQKLISEEEMVLPNSFKWEYFVYIDEETGELLLKSPALCQSCLTIIATALATPLRHSPYRGDIVGKIYETLINE